MRFSCARLTTFDDPLYLAFVAHMTASRQNQRPIRPATQRELFGNDVEQILQNWLIDHGLNLSERRILEYKERRHQQLMLKYRELDALVEAERRVHVFEIKASKNVRAIRKAYQQMRATADILRLLFQDVRLTILFVDTGIPTKTEITELMRSNDAPEEAPLTFDDILETLQQIKLVDTLQHALGLNNDQIALVRFTLDDLITLAGDHPLHMDWDTDDLLEDNPPNQPTIHSFGEDGDSPFAALLGALEKE